MKALFFSFLFLVEQDTKKIDHFVGITMPLTMQQTDRRKCVNLSGNVCNCRRAGSRAGVPGFIISSTGLFRLGSSATPL